MNIYIDKGNFSNFNENILNIMQYLHSYLDNNWKICKKECVFILTKKQNKIIISDNLKLKKNNGINSIENNIYIYIFLYNVLNSGWNIKKIKNEYIFKKKHEGKKEIFSQNYLSRFLEENFNFNLIK